MCRDNVKQKSAAVLLVPESEKFGNHSPNGSGWRQVCSVTFQLFHYSHHIFIIALLLLLL